VDDGGAMNREDFLYYIVFGIGGVCVAVIVLLLPIIPEPRPHREAALSESCHVGDKVIMTTAPKAEYYECEAHWVRK
jgi:hypothetical protein